MTIEHKQISVSLIDKMGSDKRVTNVARTSFNKWLPEDEPLTERDTGLLAYLATGLPSSERDDWEKRAKAHTHWSPFAHCFLTIRCSVPIFLARQLVKHQIGLVWSEESRRYIKDSVAIYVPEIVHKAPENAKQGASKEAHTEYVWLEYPQDDEDHTARFHRHIGVDYGAEDVIALASEEAVESYYDLLESGVAPEEARMVLPQNAMVNYIWSGSLLAFNRVYQQRIDGHAQNAAQEFANIWINKYNKIATGGVGPAGAPVDSLPKEAQGTTPSIPLGSASPDAQRASGEAPTASTGLSTGTMLSFESPEVQQIVEKATSAPEEAIAMAKEILNKPMDPSIKALIEALVRIGERA